MNAEQKRKIEGLLEEHFPKPGFRRLGQYRRAKDAITRAMLRDPELMSVNLLRQVQTSLNESASILLEELTAKKIGAPLEMNEETEAKEGPIVDAEKTENGHVVPIPYRKTG